MHVCLCGGRTLTITVLWHVDRLVCVSSVSGVATCDVLRCPGRRRSALRKKIATNPFQIETEKTGAVGRPSAQKCGENAIFAKRGIQSRLDSRTTGQAPTSTDSRRHRSALAGARSAETARARNMRARSGGHPTEPLRIMASRPLVRSPGERGAIALDSAV